MSTARCVTTQHLFSLRTCHTLQRTNKLAIENKQIEKNKAHWVKQTNFFFLIFLWKIILAAQGVNVYSFGP